MDAVLNFIHLNRPYFEAAQALSSLINILGWCLGGVILFFAWRRNSIRSVSVGPINFQMKQEAIEATAVAERNWRARVPGQRVDLDRIRSTVERAFAPETADNITGKSVLWVDDNPANNRLALRALSKLQIDVEQVTSTELGLAAMRERHFDLVISDMGRGDNLRAGYDLLKAIRDSGNQVPFLIFSSDDKPEYRKSAAAAGAQLSTNDMLELINEIIKQLGKAG